VQQGGKGKSERKKDIEVEVWNPHCKVLITLFDIWYIPSSYRLSSHIGGLVA